ncbi:hypothetical protein QTL95_19250 [Rhizobium sp. S152]|uniref:hypothetical protein n=1 Tax=Rhizobium sp. S152 TaxID=3055038 RepID=UPI0025A9FE97|nr:hypothetical protein [Rhizobium sp. S152]MDM9628032.1 hypothetical protein [Rhizobium sp. S152]
MLIILVTAAVVLSFLVEAVHGWIQDNRDMAWVRAEVSEHHAIVRRTGHVAFKPIRNSERQMNDLFKVASDRGW